MLRDRFVYNFFPSYFDVFLSVSVPETCEITSVFGNSFASSSAAASSASSRSDIKTKSSPQLSALSATAVPPSAHREPWSPVTHSLFSPSFRNTVRFLLLCQQRRVIPRLPTTILSYILNFLSPRICVTFDLSTVFPSDVDQKSGFSIGGPVLLQFKRKETLAQKMEQKILEKIQDDDRDRTKQQKIIPPGGAELLLEEERQKVIKAKETGGAKFKVQYKDRAGTIRSWTSTVPIASSSLFSSSSSSSSSLPDSFSSQATQKSVLLQQFVLTVRQFLQDAKDQKDIKGLKTQAEHMTKFRFWFEEQVKALHKVDITRGLEADSLKGELALLDQLLAKVMISSILSHVS